MLLNSNDNVRCLHYELSMIMKSFMLFALGTTYEHRNSIIKKKARVKCLVTLSLFSHCMIKQLSLFNTISVYSHVIVKLQIIKCLSHNSQSKAWS